MILADCRASSGRDFCSRFLFTASVPEPVAAGIRLRRQAEAEIEFDASDSASKAMLLKAMLLKAMRRKTVPPTRPLRRLAIPARPRAPTVRTTEYSFLAAIGRTDPGSFAADRKGYPAARPRRFFLGCSPTTEAPQNLTAMQKSIAIYTQGMQVRHRQRPEWGAGVVTRVEALTRAGVRDQRLWIKFGAAGLKTLLASGADLEIGEGTGAAEHTFAAREVASEGGWLGQIAQKKPEQAMSELPPSATDPFLLPERRLKNLLALYRFAGGAKLIDWAVAQSGLDDPLSRFNRIELEAFYKNWTLERDLALHRLVSDFRRRREPVDTLLADAPKAALQVLQKFDRAR